MSILCFSIIIFPITPPCLIAQWLSRSPGTRKQERTLVFCPIIIHPPWVTCIQVHCLRSYSQCQPSEERLNQKSPSPDFCSGTLLSLSCSWEFTTQMLSCTTLHFMLYCHHPLPPSQSPQKLLEIVYVFLVKIWTRLIVGLTNKRDKKQSNRGECCQGRQICTGMLYMLISSNVWDYGLHYKPLVQKE